MEETGKNVKEKGSALHTVTNVIGIILCVIFIPLILLNMVLIIKSYTNPKNLPTVFGVAPVIVLSGSMWPQFNAGDMIFVQKTDPNSLQTGDVICYFAEGPETAVTHRIVEIQEQNGQKVFVTRGDANNTEDSLVVTTDMVQGKYMDFYIEGLGNVAVFLQSTPGMLLCILTPLGLFFLWDMIRRVISGRKDKKEAAAALAQSQSMEEKAQEMEAELARLRAQVAQQEAAPKASPESEEGEGPTATP